MKLPIAAFVFLISAASVFSAARPASAPEPEPIALDRDPGTNAIGVEPLGGVFARVIEPNGKADGKFEFSIFTKEQVVSILSIYATDKAFIPREKPVARVRLKALKPGQMHRRITVYMSWSADRKLLISAWDEEYHQAMGIKKITEQELQNATLEEPLAGIGAAPGANLNKPDPTIQQFKQFIGVRGTGGMFEPVLAMLPNGKLITTDKPQKAPGVTYIRTAFPGARTADVTLFAGNSPFIERTKVYDHYIVSGLTNPQPKNSFQLKLEVEPNGKIKVIADELAPGSKAGKGEYTHHLAVDRYSRSALERLEASGQLGQSSPEGEIRRAGRIPADPVH